MIKIYLTYVSDCKRDLFNENILDIGNISRFFSDTFILKIAKLHQVPDYKIGLEFIFHEFREVYNKCINKNQFIF